MPSNRIRLIPLVLALLAAPVGSLWLAGVAGVQSRTAARASGPAAPDDRSPAPASARPDAESSSTGRESLLPRSPAEDVGMSRASDARKGAFEVAPEIAQVQRGEPLDFAALMLHASHGDSLAQRGMYEEAIVAYAEALRIAEAISPRAGSK